MTYLIKHEEGANMIYEYISRKIIVLMLMMMIIMILIDMYDGNNNGSNNDECIDNGVITAITITKT